MVTKEQLNEDIERRKLQRYIPVDESHRIYRSGSCSHNCRTNNKIFISCGRNFMVNLSESEQHNYDWLTSVIQDGSRYTKEFKRYAQKNRRKFLRRIKE